MTDEALIHLRVPASVKARWVRESRAAGMRLTDWLIDRIEQSAMTTQTLMMVIPPDLQFSELRLARDASGDVSFDWAPIERICRASNVPIETFRDSPEDNVAALLTFWYRAHLEAGGAPDPVQEDLIAEAAAEDAAGQPYSHAPGLA